MQWILDGRQLKAGDKKMSEDRDHLLLNEEDQEILGEVSTQDISHQVSKHASHPNNLGFMKNPDGQATLTGICEDTVGIQVHLKGRLIDDVCFQTNGCGFTLACGSVATEMVREKSLGFALGITGEQINMALGGLPREHIHCADLTANAMKAAAQNALEHLKEPWKKVYSGQNNR
jgi:nitrogen fixation protein NifU and related proteins